MTYRVYILALALLAHAAWAIAPSVTSFRSNRGCQGYLDLAAAYGFQALAYWLVAISSLVALLAFAVIANLRCEGFGCLGVAPMAATTGIVVPPLICGLSLWFLAARYQWSPRRFLATSLGAGICLLLAYSQTPGF